MADYSQKWHDGTSTRSKSSNTSNGLAAIQAQLNNLGRKIKKVNESVYAAQSSAPGFYRRDNGNTSYQERRKMMEESLNKFMAEYAKIHDENFSLIKEIQSSTDAAIKNQGASIKELDIQIEPMSKVLQERGYGSLPSLTETNPRDHVKSITTTEEVETLKEDNKMPMIEFGRGRIPFRGNFKENGYDEKEMVKELKKLKVNSIEYSTSLRIFLKENSRIEEEIKATMKVHC
ncbi:hypothetical protein Tco_0814977 [Tanacetum coccineum]